MVATSEMVLPLHKGLLPETEGAGGSGLTMAVVDADELVHPFTVAVTLYFPAFIKPTLLITGF